MLKPGGPADGGINPANAPAGLPATDQRGVTRPRGAYADIGAVELTKVQSLTISGANSVMVGGDIALSAATTPALTEGPQGISWSSGNASTATVDSSGKVTGVAVGSVTITATHAAAVWPKCRFHPAGKREFAAPGGPCIQGKHPSVPCAVHLWQHIVSKPQTGRLRRRTGCRRRRGLRFRFRQADASGGDAGAARAAPQQPSPCRQTT